VVQASEAKSKSPQNHRNHKITGLAVAVDPLATDESSMNPPTPENNLKISEENSILVSL
jgi:hypothetical protein